jgi:hypothetical protein
MLGKLIRHEIKSTARIFLPLYAVLLVFALLNRYLNPLQVFDSSGTPNLESMLKGISISLYVILIIAVFVLTLVIVIQRFYKNLLGDEGYLMFTLPVKAWQHILSKFLTAVIWYFMTAASVVISVMILIGADKLFDFLPQLIQMIREAFGSSGPVVLPAFILSQMAAGTLMIYSSMALGHLFQKNRLMYSFAMYCALYAAYQIILAILILLLGNNLFESLLQSAAPTPAQLNSLFGMLAAVAVLMAVVHFVLTNHILTRKLNLE